MSAGALTADTQGGWAPQRGPLHCTDEDTEARRRAEPGPEPPASRLFLSFSGSGLLPPPTGLPERVTDSPQVTQQIPRFPQHQGLLFLCFQCLWWTSLRRLRVQEAVPLELLQA